MTMVPESKPPLAVERRGHIIELIRQQKSVRVGELSRQFQVSEVTIRNDLDLLAREGLVSRSRGGASLNTQPSLVIAFDQRAGLNLDEKRRIGAAAVQLVSPGDTITMDSGTTIMEMARRLSDSPVTVVTNALNIAIEVGKLPRAQVILVGGLLSRETICTIGPHTERALSDLTVQKVFLATHAFDLDAGVTDTSLEMAEVKRSMIHAARQKILLADSSKWGRKSFAKVVPLSVFHTIISDVNLPEEAIVAIHGMGIRLILV